MITATNSQKFIGLTTEQVSKSRQHYGANRLEVKGVGGVRAVLLEVVSEPMFILLSVACALYFILGQGEEGAVLIVALLMTAGISVYQDLKSERALNSLRQLTQPTADVLRDDQLETIPVEDLVVGDLVRLEEGQRIPADGRLVQSADLTVDEAILTGEAMPVFKTTEPSDCQLFAGTVTTSGSGWFTVEAVGMQTKLGLIGESIETIEQEKSPLQRQISQFVVRMAWIGSVAFLLVWGINFARTGDVITSLLFGLTLAMSVLPEEVPVAFSSFMALGASRLSRIGVLVKRPQTVESLGAATVICADKTGTLTIPGMVLKQLYVQETDSLIKLSDTLLEPGIKVLTYARWASESDPFDPMEKAIGSAYSPFEKEQVATNFPIVYEYPLSGNPPMMTHVRRGPDGRLVVAGKGAVEHVLAVCQVDELTLDRVRAVTRDLSGEGLRVLAVAGASHVGTTFPESQDQFQWSFLGLVALENPPRDNAHKVIKSFGEAGIQVKMITGDHPETAQAIARQVGLPHSERLLTGVQIMALDESALREVVGPTTVFARMFPEAKLRIVEALKSNGEVVAMTGDGVNDGPALRAAHIGVAMGQRGTEVARAAASLVLVNDDLANIVDAIAQGRKIYQNLQKAVSYIVSIHIPIILTVAVPLLVGWEMANLFNPIHVIFLELVMGPTCSIAFENEPAEKFYMHQPPRSLKQTFLGGPALGRSILQGLMISGAVLVVYFVFMTTGNSAATVRTSVFITLVMSNLFLTLVNRSFKNSIWHTLRLPNPTLWLLLGLTLALLLATLLMPAVKQLFGFSDVSWMQLCQCLLAAGLGVFWMEVYKAVKPLFSKK